MQDEIEWLRSYQGVLGGQDLLGDAWNVVSWMARPGNRKTHNVYFAGIKNHKLNIYTRIYLLDKRKNMQMSHSNASVSIGIATRIDMVLGERSFFSLNNEDIEEVEKNILAECADENPTYLMKLASFSRWLARFCGLDIDYHRPDGKRPDYGREGTERGRTEKLMSDELLVKMFELAGSDSTPFVDKFYLSAVVVAVAISARVTELATLPFDCLVKVDGNYGVRVYSEKGGQIGVRFFPQVLLPAVENALDFLKFHTDEGRSIVKKIRANPRLDWRVVVGDVEALRYFVKKFVAEWCENNPLYDSRSVWFRRLGCFVDAVGLLEKHNYNAQEAALAFKGSYKNIIFLANKQQALKDGKYLFNQNNREVTLSQDEGRWKEILRSDPRAISCKVLSAATGIQMSDYIDKIRDILDFGLECQFLNEKYLPPSIDENKEMMFVRVVSPVIVDKYGCTLLEPEDALFVIPRNLLTAQVVLYGEFQCVSGSMLSSWLRSFFERFKIVEKKTGRVAIVRWHDFRHWMNTAYKEGGLTDRQVSLLSGRKNFDQTAVYDQLSVHTRTEILQDIRDNSTEGRVIGHIVDTYKSLMSDSPLLAEKYLTAATGALNWMPHGACLLNLALTPCPHNLSCFVENGSGKPCSHLIVDKHSKEQFREISTINENAKSLMLKLTALGGGNSPQYEHQKAIVSNTNDMLDLIFREFQNTK